MSSGSTEALELIAQARTLENAGRLSDAAETYVRAVRSGADDQTTWIALARLLMQIDWPRVDRAVTAGLRVRETDSGLSAAWAARAVLAMEEKDERLAAAAAWQAQRFAPAGMTSPDLDRCRRISDVDLLARASSEPERDLDVDGYAVLPGAVSEAVLSRLRAFAATVPPFTPGTPADPRGYNVLETCPAAIELALSPDVLRFVERLVGSAPINLVALSSMNTGLFTSWHTDTAAMAKGGRTYGDGRHTLVVTQLTYLQDNLPFLGGGLDVRPGSHRDRETTTARPRTIATRAGDILFFDSRLLHRATPSLVNAGDGPRKAIFSMKWAAEASYGRSHQEAYMKMPDGSALPIRTEVPAWLADRVRNAGARVL